MSLALLSEESFDERRVMMTKVLERESFIKHAAGLSVQLGLGVEKAYEIVDVFNSLGLPDDYFLLNEHGQVLVTNSDHSNTFSFEIFLSLAGYFGHLKNVKGFENFTKSLLNSEQFSATAFEAKCAVLVMAGLRNKGMEIYPYVKNGSGMKSPDFSVLLQLDKVLFCECKSLLSINRAKNSKCLRLMKSLGSDFTKKIAADHRLEILIRALPTKWDSQLFREELLTNYHSMVTGGVAIAIRKVLGVSVLMSVCRKSDPVYFSKHMMVYDKESYELSSLVVAESPNLKKGIKSAIRDAISQLPENDLSAIFCETLPDPLIHEAVMEFLRDNPKKKLVGVFLVSDRVQFVENPLCGDKLSDYGMNLKN
jgi:hypothetical protein